MLEAKDLSRGNIFYHLIAMAIPIMGTSFLQMAYNFADIMWLGRLDPKPTSVAAVGIVSVFVWIASSFSLLTKIGAEVSISNSIGANEELSITKRLASHSILIALILGLLTFAVYQIFMSDFLSIYQQSEEERALSIDYFTIVNLAFPFIFMSQTFFGIYNASGHSRIPFRIMGLGLVLNIILDPFLIHSFDIMGYNVGVNLGVKGAALATLLSQLIVFVIFYFTIFKRDKLFGGFRFFEKLSLKTSKYILGIGVPVASLNMLFAIITLKLGSYASIFGTVIMATFTTGGQLEGLTWNTAQGFTTALSNFVGQNNGACRFDRIKAAFKRSLLLSCVVGILGSILFIFWGRELFCLIIPNEDTADAGALYLRIAGYTQIFMMIEITSQGLLYGLKRSMPPAIISIVGNIMRIPIAIFLVFTLGWNELGLWWALGISSTIKGIAAFSYAVYILKKLEKDSSTGSNVELSA